MKSTVDEIRQRFDADVERFSNLETGQSATVDAPLAMALVAEAAAVTTPHARHVLDVGCGAGNYTLKLLESLPNTLKMVPEVCRIYCATGNPTEVVLAETETVRGILGVVDGFSPKGVEDEAEIRWRKDFLRKIGYKL